MALPPPQYDGVLAEFITDLRSRLFSSQREAAEYFGVTRPTISRYENDVHRPPLGYLAALICLLVDRQEEAEANTYRNALLSAANQAVRDRYQDLIFASWAELTAEAEAYLDKSRRSQSADKRKAGQGASDQSKIESPTATPAEAPPLPHFYVERQSLQQRLSDKVKDDEIHTLVLWGQGGTGKTTLAAWLTHTLRTNFSEGQLWVTLPDNLSSEESVTEAQRQLGRSFGVVLDGLSLAERAGQLRTLLHNRRCLIVIDDVWVAADLEHLQVVNEQSCLLLTTRYKKVADVLEAPYFHVTGMTNKEGLALLSNWANYPVTSVELISRLGGLPLALKLSGVQLREGSPPADLLTYFQHNPAALDHLDLDQPQTEADSLAPCFDRSLNRLPPQEQAQLARLSCFTGRFDAVSGAAISDLDAAQSPRIWRRWHNLALLEREERHYQMHPLLRHYLRQKLLATSIESQAAHRRHAVYHIRRYLYHPQILDDVTDEAPNLDDRWPDIVEGVRWATQNAPRLAAIATLLAHTERLALVKSVGRPLLEAVETYLVDLSDTTEAAILHELLGELYLFSNLNYEVAQFNFETAGQNWLDGGHSLAGCRSLLRVAGTHLLNQKYKNAAQVTQKAQRLLKQSLPISDENLPEAGQLFYWFNVVYSVLAQWPELPEQDVQTFAELAQQTEQDLLKARGWHVYRLWATDSQRLKKSEDLKRQGRSLAAKAAWLWRRCHKRDQALAEIMWTQEATTGRRHPWLAKAFAQRRARMTPALSQDQLELVTNEKLKSWLAAGETEQVNWLVNHLPAPGAEDWGELEDILDAGILGREVRYLVRGVPRPDHLRMDKTIWRVLSGQKILPLAGKVGTNLVTGYLKILEDDLS